MKYPSLLLYLTLAIGFLGATSCGQDNAQNNASQYEMAALANAKLNPVIVNQTVTATATSIVNQTNTQVITVPTATATIIYTVTATSSNTSTNRQ